ncbi:ankyrin repeat domain-containing protein [Streptomyces sp. TRM49041]|uniref:ankyrin repeat domain-containing protein n=1 Tax=Streptomyces sp. TRM49041 TaxID=2603216 RepID=UPI0011ECDCB0|nr:ankyrin repeat domain-containing protein [Streptomyces sp. TRM49041]
MSPLPPDEAAAWRRVRRYAVPRWMIERATAHRLTGDWAGACAAARVDVAFDLRRVAARHGAETAAALLDDLRHLAPDLLRWHLPRVMGGWTTLATDLTVVLAHHSPPGGRSTGLCLYVTTPPMVRGPQRLTLRFGAAGTHVTPSRTSDWSTARHLWDARHTAGLRERCGGGPDRAPFCHPDGTPLRPDELPTRDPGPADPAGHTEWVALRTENGEVDAALAAVGIDFDPTPPATSHGWYGTRPEQLLRARARTVNLTRLAPELRLLADRHGHGRFQFANDWGTTFLLELAESGPTDTVRMTVARARDSRGVPHIPEALSRHLPDIDLVRGGVVAPAQLHPLVAGALFPALDITDGPAGPPPGPDTPEPVRVRCRGEWHQVVFRDGGLRMPHSEEERRRERALRAFGGAVAGCFATHEAWTSASGRLPKAMRAQRRDLFLRAQHGDTPGVLALLDAGVDPHVRDSDGRTLLHALNLLDHDELLPRLLAAGVGLEATDYLDRTPLFTAVADRGTTALVEALLAAGARIDVTDSMERSLAHIIRIYRRKDLAFLRERVQEEHPGIGADWWDDWSAYRDDEDDEPEEDEYDEYDEPDKPEEDDDA